MKPRCRWALEAPLNSLWRTMSRARLVNAVMEQAKKAGAIITVPAHDAFWGGYTGSFQDPTGISGKSPGTLIGNWRTDRGLYATRNVQAKPRDGYLERAALLFFNA